MITKRLHEKPRIKSFMVLLLFCGKARSANSDIAKEVGSLQSTACQLYYRLLTVD